MHTVHSALEGFCRAFSDTDARMTKTDQDDAAFDVGWSFFPDRFDSVLASGRRNSHKCKETWTLSNDILQGKCRQKTFEVQWTGRTIVRKPEDEANLREAAAIEKDAVYACIKAGLSDAREGFERTALYSLWRNEPVALYDGAGQREKPALLFFYDTVLDALCAGMLNEGQDVYEIDAYKTSLGDFVNDACAPLAQDEGASMPRDLGANRIELLKRVVAGIIYGPGHPLALSRKNVDTNPYAASEQLQIATGAALEQSRRLALFQTFDRNKSTMAQPFHVLEPNAALFVGRSDKTEDYLRKIERIATSDSAHETGGALLAKAADEALQGKRASVWKISEAHRGVSNAHGLIVYVGGSSEDDGDPGLGWTYFDLQSTYGTWCDGSFVEGMRKINRGALLFLGPDADRPEDSPRSYRTGACIATATVCGRSGQGEAASTRGL